MVRYGVYVTLSNSQIGARGWPGEQHRDTHEDHHRSFGQEQTLAIFVPRDIASRPRGYHRGHSSRCEYEGSLPHRACHLGAVRSPRVGGSSVRVEFLLMDIGSRGPRDGFT